MCALDDRKELLIFVFLLLFKFFFFFPEKHPEAFMGEITYEMHFKILRPKNSTHVHTHTL